MNFQSTRGQAERVPFSRAVATGLAPDGGLYLPEDLPSLGGYLQDWEKLSYPDLCCAFFRIFADDVDSGTLRDLIHRSYENFDHPDIAPLRRLDDRLFVLELFHGPTLAFKDFALQILGNLFAEQIRSSGASINALGATSGDTGSAAIHGLLGKKGVNIFILYPEGRISQLQERQMACTGAANVYPLAIDGSFDDAQRALKETFADTEFREQYRLSAVNSINIARIIAQCVYYLYAWFRLPEDCRESVEFAVPTGNFGNILAGWMVQKMGLPATSFKISTNQNDILYRLFQSGVYEVKKVAPSLAPSMDIQIASNFERFLFYAEKKDSDQLRAIMAELQNTGKYSFSSFDRSSFSTSRTTDSEISRIIKRMHEKYDYVVDPHTACAFKDLSPDKTTIVLATAHPAKFPETIIEAIGEEPQAKSLEALKDRPIVKYHITADKASIQNFIREHSSN